MTITISPFVLGIICTLGSEFLALILLIIFSTIKNSVKTRRNASNSSRSDKNE